MQASAYVINEFAGTDRPVPAEENNRSSSSSVIAPQSTAAPGAA